MPGQLGPNWNGWARFSSSYTEAVNEVRKNLKKIRVTKKRKPKKKTK